MKTALSIAGSDSSGGAGIQADIKTMSALGVYAMSAITAITAQNTLGVQGVQAVSPEMVAQQIDSVFSDIRPDAVKIGMLCNEGIVRTIAERLKYYQAQHVVLDTVILSTSGRELLDANGVQALREELLPLAEIVTPNLPEVAYLSGVHEIHDQNGMVTAAKALSCDAAVLVKGGHLADVADDLLYVNDECHWFRMERIDVRNTHGTGCTLSSAIAAGLAMGYDVVQAVAMAKKYITEILRHDPQLGHGNGPLNHFAARL
ncbi:MAG: bifunctional hydroxymethylpyrimidine kinase/phosphomethylpyrimidine kinase [Victivallales bacterium]|nr:bifunctional hydroxymethylpyrimidine kinase/phosphomethylpyrimidine kinase [Victivallales bacterium]